jgi:hypothetical protein
MAGFRVFAFLLGFGPLLSVASSSSSSCPGDLRYFVHDNDEIANTAFVVSETGKNEEGFYKFGDLYATEMVLIESFLNSPCRTYNFDSADFFVVPVAPLRQGGMGWDTDGNVFMDFAGVKKLLETAQSNIAAKFPNLWETKAHVFFLGHDYGSCLSPSDLASRSIILSPNGDHFNPTAALSYCSGVSQVMRNASIKRKAAGHFMLGGSWGLGDSPGATCLAQQGCFVPDRQVVVPPYIGSLKEILLAREHFRIEQEVAGFRASALSGVAFLNKTKRRILLHFRGTVLEHKRYSVCGERQVFRDLYGNKSSFEGLGVVSSTNSLDMKDYLEELAGSIFCYSPSGWAGWSPRFIQAMVMGCIPVFVACGDQGVFTERPFEAHFDYNAFSVRVSVEMVKEGRLLDVLNELVRDKTELVVKRIVQMSDVWRSFVIRPEGGKAFRYLLEDIRSRIARRV